MSSRIAAHVDLAKVSFTGSCVTGRLILQYAQESNMKRVSLELGGKSALLVMEDADVGKARPCRACHFAK